MGHKKVVRIDPETKKQARVGVDSHAHVNDPAFDGDRAQVLARAAEVGIAQVINIFLDPLTFAEQRKLFDGYDWVYFALGIHPCDGSAVTEAHIAALSSAFATEPRLRAVGEIGLDYYWKDCPRELQIDLFVKQLLLAKALNKPVILHCRDAESDCLMLLEAHGFVGYPLLWHCFGGDVALARRILANGWHISIPGAATYPKNTALREAIAIIPKDRLLLETDCPYLAPHPWRGTRNEPAYTVFTAEAIAAARDCSVAEVWAMCGENARRFFGLTSGEEGRPQ